MPEELPYPSRVAASSFFGTLAAVTAGHMSSSSRSWSPKAACGVAAASLGAYLLLRSVRQKRRASSAAAPAASPDAVDDLLLHDKKPLSAWGAVQTRRAEEPSAEQEDASNKYGTLDSQTPRSGGKKQPGALQFPLSANMVDLRKKFETDGYVVIRKVLSDKVVGDARQVCENAVDALAKKMRKEGKNGSLFQEESFAKRIIKIFEEHPDEAPKIFRKELHSEGMGKLFFNSDLLDVVERILGDPEIRLYPNYALYPKMPSDQQPTETAWHAGRMAHLADYTEEQVRESMAGMVNVWTPLVPVTKTNGCVKLVPGSHKLDVLSLLPRPGSRGFHASRDKGYLEVDSELMKQHESKAVDIELEPGDVLLFKQQIIHCGNPNMSDGVRWSIDWRYQNAELHTLREEQVSSVQLLTI